jgi:phosphatidylglycerol:prolipoprotein diacylglycerol transferase
MFDTLFHIRAEIGGLPVFGFGLLLAVWCVFGVILLAVVAKRQGIGPDFWSYVPLLVIVAAAVAFLLPRLVHEGKGLPIQGYGVMLLIAVVTSTGLLAWRAKRYGFDPDMMVSLVFWGFVPGIVGARLFYVIQYWENFHQPGQSFAVTLGNILSFNHGGLVVYGSLICGMLGIFAFMIKHRLPVLAICDLLAPSLVLGLAIGRIGCFAHGCCFGGPCDLPWAIEFPEGTPPFEQQLARGQLWGFSLGDNPEAPPVIASVTPDSPAARAGLREGDRLTHANGVKVEKTGEVAWRMRVSWEKGDSIRFLTEDARFISLPTDKTPKHSLPVHPTQLYSSINAFLLCFFLLAYTPFRRRDGEVFALMLTIYPISRFLLEIIRTDEGASLGTSLSISQNISLFILLGIIAFWIIVLRRPKGTVLVAQTKP